MEKINMKNIKINGTFGEYIESIVSETRKLLSASLYTVEISDGTWGTTSRREGGLMSKVIFLNGRDAPNCHFSIAELEFMTLQQYAPEALTDLVKTRLTDTIDSVKGLHDAFDVTIKEIKGRLSMLDT